MSRKIYFSFFSLLSSSILFAQSAIRQEVPPNLYQNLFNEVYNDYPEIPKGLLEAISFSQTRFRHIFPEQNQSCVGLPAQYGLMGLTLDGKNYFQNNLLEIAQVSGISVDSIKYSPFHNILSYAKAYVYFKNKLKSELPVSEEIKQITLRLSELPFDKKDLVNDFARNSFLYQIFCFLNNFYFQEAYNFPNQDFNIPEVFGENNYKVLSSRRLKLSSLEVKNEYGIGYKIDDQNSLLSSDYAPAQYTPASSCNFSTRNGVPISSVAIHTVQGSYSGCISWFQNCTAGVSAHYVIRSSDGQITQMVNESMKAWHVGSENPYTIGLEHEGYINNSSWYTQIMYQASADLVKDICSSGYGINALRTFNGNSCSGVCPTGGCVKVKGHQHFPNQTHTDPGQNWDWFKYYNLINNSILPNILTSSSGMIYDSGGAGLNYQNDERTIIKIQPPAANSITLNFSQFDLESNWDYLFIHDGPTVNDPLIGRFTGNANPGIISSSSGSMLLDFRSDCATTSAGWIASYTSVTGNLNSIDSIRPLTQVISNGTWKTQNFPISILDTDDPNGSGIKNGFYSVNDFNGLEWRANADSGFFSDNFDQVIHPDWTIPNFQGSGTWSVIAGSLNQNDETSTNTSICAFLNQNDNPKFLYHFTAKIEGVGANRRAGFHFFADQKDSSNRGNSYFVWFRVDNSKLQLYKVQNNFFGSPLLDIPLNVVAGQWYDYKIIYDNLSGEILVFRDNFLIGNYVDPSPIVSGSYISFRSGNSNFSINDLKVYKSRNSLLSVSVGNNSNQEIRYQNSNPQTASAIIKSICIDSANNLSIIDNHFINIDFSNPLNIDSLRDGLNQDIDYTNSLTSLSANWDSSFDSSSSVLQYWYAIGQYPGDTSITGWVSNMASRSVTHSGLSLIQGQIYYFSVKAENGAGLFSPLAYSDGQIVDTNVISLPNNYLNNKKTINVFPNPFAESINLEIPEAEIKLLNFRIIDLLGNSIKIEKSIIGKNKISIRFSDIETKSAIYILEIEHFELGKVVYKILRN